MVCQLIPSLILETRNSRHFSPSHCLVSSLFFTGISKSVQHNIKNPIKIQIQPGARQEGSTGTSCLFSYFFLLSLITTTPQQLFSTSARALYHLEKMAVLCGWSDCDLGLLWEDVLLLEYFLMGFFVIPQRSSLQGIWDPSPFLTF